MTAPPRTLIAVVLVVTAVAVFRSSSVVAQGSPTNQRLAALESQVATLQGQVATLLLANATLQGNFTAEAATRGTADTALQTQIDNISTVTVPQELLDLTNYVDVFPAGKINNLEGPHIIFFGANVHIQNGENRTDTTNGLGNLIVGYNEMFEAWNRNGSHNVVVGTDHRYSSFGGLVVGQSNGIDGPYASVSGGSDNSASGVSASVSGGRFNFAGPGIGFPVIGGSGSYAAVSGGHLNRATGEYAAVSGGFGNHASNTGATVSGGQDNTASAPGSTVSGGELWNASEQNSHLP